MPHLVSHTLYLRSFQKYTFFSLLLVLICASPCGTKYLKYNPFCPSSFGKMVRYLLGFTGAICLRIVYLKTGCC